jgi:HAD superfamily hydrolase (TIGR01490 family)
MLEDLGRRCFEEEIRPRLAPVGERRIAEHRASGHMTVLLSGSLPFLLRPMAEVLGVDEVIGSVMATRGQRLSGRLEGVHPYGRDKLRLIEQFAAARGIHLPGSFAYADHHSDAHLLERVGHPVAVNPDQGLRLLAEARGWPIESWP